MFNPTEYEYFQLTDPDDDTLNSFGRRGWRVVSVLMNPVKLTTHVLLERVRPS